MDEKTERLVLYLQSFLAQIKTIRAYIRVNLPEYYGDKTELAVIDIIDDYIELRARMEGLEK